MMRGPPRRASWCMLRVVRSHPALRVIAGQLAMLFSVDQAGASVAEYDTVEARAKSLE
jgi:hypothetical protein